MQFTQIRSATAILTYAGKRILIDPMFAEQFSLPGLPLSADPPLRNPTSPLPCPVEELLQVDAVFATHLHYDHFDAEAIRRLPKDILLFCGDETDAAELRGHGFTDVRPLPAEGALEWACISVTRTPALHGRSPWSADIYARLGVRYAACGAVFQAPDEPTFYLAGDTVWFEGVEQTLKAFKPDIVALNACCARLVMGGPIIMGTEDVWQVAMAAPKAKLIATHMEGVSHATLTRRTLRAFAEDNAFADRLLIPADGETLPC